MWVQGLEGLKYVMKFGNRHTKCGFAAHLAGVSSNFAERRLNILLFPCADHEQKSRGYGTLDRAAMLESYGDSSRRWRPQANWPRAGAVAAPRMTKPIQFRRGSSPTMGLSLVPTKQRAQTRKVMWKKLLNTRSGGTTKRFNAVCAAICATGTV